MQKYVYVWSLFLLTGIFVVGFTYAGEKLCDTISWISEIKGISLSVSEQEEGKCERMYQVTGDINEILKKVRDGFTERGWEIKDDTDVTVAGTTSHVLKLKQESMKVEIAAHQDANKETTLAIELKQYEGAEDEPVKAKVKTKSVDDETLESMAKKLPIPDGASFMSKSYERHDYVLTYQYRGDIEKAFNWVLKELKKQGWKIDNEDMTETALGTGADIDAHMGHFELEVAFANAIAISTIVYTLHD
ncbi:MAG: hypothetical protein A2Y62_09210 [Candidatus Fischerbacteria bacterium RBG_13_37_8]|uniref:Uncharacterized protein n=1 Tax=Candidatus Fischerbacteria bacterium RBG_13_37_8 TaxID=1817863 RepID=A0A1F5VK11_9BACT|nr:MAG: hypothetical protein A2Y62_09210 [Candidatus Fischerbacteria bacterium RBG_13_37_8]